MRTPSNLIASPALVAIAAAIAAAFAPAAMAARPDITVAVHSASGGGSSYFALTGRPGGAARAGPRRPGRRRL